MVGKLREKDIEQKRASMLQQQPRSCAHWRWWRWYFLLWFSLIAVAFSTSFLWGLAALHVPPFSTNWNKQHNPSVAATVSYFDPAELNLRLFTWGTVGKHKQMNCFDSISESGYLNRLMKWSVRFLSRLVHKVYHVFCTKTGQIFVEIISHLATFLCFILQVVLENFSLKCFLHSVLPLYCKLFEICQFCKRFVIAISVWNTSCCFFVCFCFLYSSSLEQNAWLL